MEQQNKTVPPQRETSEDIKKRMKGKWYFIIASLITLELITLKCYGVIQQPWWKVTLPLWGAVVFILLIGSLLILLERIAKKGGKAK